MTTITRAIHRRWVDGIRAEGVAIGQEQGIAIGERRGVEQAREGQRALICRQARLRFGAEEVSTLPGLLAGLSERSDLDRAADWVVECTDAAELLRRVAGKTGNGAPNG